MTPADRTRRILRELLAVEDMPFSDESHLVNDLKADSLDAVEITMALEVAFDIHLTDDETAACTTVGDWIKLVEGRVGL
jgi:acyl carrier protein